MESSNAQTKKIESFNIDHKKLLPGVYKRKQQYVDNVVITTYDIRMTRPNREPVMDTSTIHAIEHIIATYLRMHSDYSEDIVYFGPMGCRTGFYLVMIGDHEIDKITRLLLDAFTYVCEYTGDVVGATIEECGNYLDINLPMAKHVSEIFINRVLKR